MKQIVFISENALFTEMELYSQNHDVFKWETNCEKHPSKNQNSLITVWASQLIQ